MSQLLVGTLLELERCIQCSLTGFGAINHKTCFLDGLTEVANKSVSIPFVIILSFGVSDSGPSGAAP